MHNKSQVLMGATLSSNKKVTNYKADPAQFLAGKFVSMNSSGDISLLKSAGVRLGVSLGKSLSYAKKLSVLREGEGVPVLLSLKKAKATVTITAYANLVSGTADKITINSTDFTAQAGSVTPGGGTFQAATNNNATAASLAAQINAHAVIGLLVKAEAVGAVVTIAALVGGAGGNAITIAYTDNSSVGATLGNATGGHLNSGSDVAGDIDYVVKGAKVYVDDITGMASEALPGASISDGFYAVNSGVISGIQEDKSSAPAAIIDLPGGF